MIKKLVFYFNEFNIIKSYISLFNFYFKNLLFKIKITIFLKFETVLLFIIQEIKG